MCFIKISVKKKLKIRQIVFELIFKPERGRAHETDEQNSSVAKRVFCWVSQKVFEEKRVQLGHLKIL